MALAVLREPAATFPCLSKAGCVGLIETGYSLSGLCDLCGDLHLKTWVLSIKYVNRPDFGAFSANFANHSARPQNGCLLHVLADRLGLGPGQDQDGNQS